MSQRWLKDSWPQAASQGLHLSSALIPGLFVCGSLWGVPVLTTKPQSQFFPLVYGPTKGMVGSNDGNDGFWYVNIFSKDEK